MECILRGYDIFSPDNISPTIYLTRQLLTGHHLTRQFLTRHFLTSDNFSPVIFPPMTISHPDIFSRRQFLTRHFLTMTISHPSFSHPWQYSSAKWRIQQINSNSGASAKYQEFSGAIAYTYRNKLGFFRVHFLGTFTCRSLRQWDEIVKWDSFRHFILC